MASKRACLGVFQGLALPGGFALKTHTYVHAQGTVRQRELQAGTRWRGQRHTGPLSQHALGFQKQGKPLVSLSRARAHGHALY